MRTPSTDIFGPVEDNNDENIEEEVEEEEDTSSSEEEGEADDDDEPVRWSLSRQNFGEDLKETCLKEVQRFLDRGKTKDYAENDAFNSLLPVCRGRLQRTFLERLKWIPRIKL